MDNVAGEGKERQRWGGRRGLAPDVPVLGGGVLAGKCGWMGRKYAPGRRGGGEKKAVSDMGLNRRTPPYMGVRFWGVLGV